MKFSQQWLREWVNPPISSAELAEQLTLAGLEVDSVRPVAPFFNHVVVGYVLEVTPHPNADCLRVCQVDIGENEPLSIVCGAANVSKGLKVAAAKVGAILPNNFKIKKSKIRGVESQGMLCSEAELGLAETSSGIMELPTTAPISEDIRSYLKLDDNVIDIELTPNRGDCLSIRGIAREVAAINQIKLTDLTGLSISNFSTDKLPVSIKAKEGCSHYIGRMIKSINPHVETPLWMREKLRRSDIRLISPTVDITNYVMLELGQPLHAFDLKLVQKGIEVRFAKVGERIELLNQQQINLNQDDLIIASDNKPIALAGIMGDIDSSVSSNTTDLFLESALFSASHISRTARKLSIFTDSSHRFERGVDYNLQKLAIERATQLILEIAGGQAGDVVEEGEAYVERTPILLRRHRIQQVLGIELTDEEVVNILQRLNMQVDSEGVDWKVIPPSYRPDLVAEIELIGELARLKGHNHIPKLPLLANLYFLPVPETQLKTLKIKNLLAGRGYQEAITYSFVDPNYERQLALQLQPLTLLNPISHDLSVMRTNHWPGLLKAYQYNAYRQQPRVRLFEVGLCFRNDNGEVHQELHLGGICTGPLMAEQWGESKRLVDFYDVKADIENLFKLTRKSNYSFQKVDHPALHPGKSASIIYDQVVIGLVGALHPSLVQKFDIQQPLYLFDLKLDSIMDIPLPTYSPISKFPAIRRDLALVVATDVPAGRIREKILDSGGELLKNVQIFDVYQGKGIETGKKSIAFSLTFQHTSRTLVDAEINDFMQKTIAKLHEEFNATLRD